MSELHGMSVDHAIGWLVLAFPLAGLDRDRARLARCCRAARPGWIGSAAIGLAFLSSIGALVAAPGQAGGARGTLTSSLWDYVGTAGVDVKLGILVDPLAVFMALVVSGVSFLIHVYSVAYMDARPRLRALLQLPQLLRLLDAAAGAGRQLRDPDRRLGVRRLRLLRADQLLVPAPHRDRTRA